MNGLFEKLKRLVMLRNSTNGFIFLLLLIYILIFSKYLVFFLSYFNFLA